MKIALLALAAGLLPLQSHAQQILSRRIWRCYGNEDACRRTNGAWADSDLAKVAKDLKKVRIIVHHTADSAEELPNGDEHGRDVIQSITRSHKKRGFDTIGYHYVLDKRGRLWEGRPLERLGAHVTKTRGIGNEGSIGIAVVGDFEKERMTAEQVVILQQFIDRFTTVFGISLDNVITHQHVEATLCPGKGIYSKGVLNESQLPHIVAAVARAQRARPIVAQGSASAVFRY